MGTFTIRPAEQQDVIDALNDTNIRNTINALAPYSGYTQVSKKLDNFVFQTSTSFLNKVADKNRFVKFGDKVVDTYGPELVTNGDFSSGTTGWTNATVVDGKLIKSSTNEYQLLLPDYKTVLITYTVSKYVASPSLMYFDTAFRVIHTALDVGTFSIVVALPNVNGYLYLVGGEGSEIDNISVREIQTADFTNTVPDVAEVITNGSNTTSVAVSQGNYVVDGSELVTNGTFDSNTIWLKTAGWTIVGGIATNDGSGTDHPIYQVGNCDVGTKYLVKFDILNYTSGTLEATIGGKQGFKFSGNGTYSFVITPNTNGNPAFYSQLFVGSVDNISIKRVSTTFRAKQDAPIGTALTNTTYFEDRTSLGVTNTYLDAHKEDSGVYVGKVSELLLSDVSKEDLLDNPTWLARNGYSKVSKYLYLNGTSKYAISAIFNSLNKGLYHLVLNPMGTKKASDNKLWYETTVSFTSVADCFNTSKLLTASGYIASGVSGRPDGKYYDVCYSDLVHDVREYSKILNRDEVNLIIADKEENGVEEVSFTLQSRDYIAGKFGYYDQTNFTLGIKSVLIYDNIGKYTGRYVYVFNETQSKYFYGYVNGVVYTDGGLKHIALKLIATDYTGSTGYISGDGYYIKCLSNSILSSNTKLQPKIIANPTYYSQVMKDRLASGVGIVGLLPDLADDTGVSNLPNGSKTVFKLNGKFTTKHQVLKSTDSGATWSLLTLTTHYTVNKITNSITFVTAPASTDMILIADTDKCLPYIQTTPKPVIDVEPKVIASNSHSIYKGALIGNQVSGKIQVGNGTNGYESKLLENTEVNKVTYRELTISGSVTYNNRVYFNVTPIQSSTLEDLGSDGGSFGDAPIGYFIGTNGVKYNIIRTNYVDSVRTIAICEYVGNISSYVPIGGKVYIQSQIITTPAHQTIALDNSNSSASKIFKVLEQGNNGVVGSVYGMELTVGGDTGNFSQLTNGTTTDWNGSTVRTFCGHIPINAEVE